MFYVVNNHLNKLYVLSNKAVGPGKNPKLINVGPTSSPEARVVVLNKSHKIEIKKFTFLKMYESACHYKANEIFE